MPTAQDPSALTTRLLTADDVAAWYELDVEAFGTWPAGATPPTAADFGSPGEHSWGTFADGRLVAKAVAREFTSWFRGAEVATSGIASVAVSAEHRGAGLLRGLLLAALTEGAARGEVVSTLFPTAPGIYRPLGYELIGSYDTVELPTAALTTVRPAAGITLHRATSADVPEASALYDAWAAQQNGPLTRRGVSYPATDEQLLGRSTGTTLARDEDGRLVGWVSWRRGPGYDPDTAVLDVPDLVSLTPDAARALWRMLGSFSGVAGRVRLRTSGYDVSRLVLPFHAWQVVDRHPYMLRLHDVAAAFDALPLSLPGGGSGELTFAVRGDLLGSDGDYRLQVSQDGSSCTPVPADEVSETHPVFTPQGIAMAYAGTQSCANLRLAGHLEGGSPTGDLLLDTLLGGRQVHIRNYF